MDFISSSSFQGIKFGYIYKNDRNGIGYYIDKKKNNYGNFYMMKRISSHKVNDIINRSSKSKSNKKQNDNYFKYHCKNIRSYYFNKDNDRDIHRYLWSPVLIVSNTYIYHLYIIYQLL